jgi:hypothetical protein
MKQVRIRVSFLALHKVYQFIKDSKDMRTPNYARTSVLR